MRVIVLGGAGVMGSRTVEDLAGSDGVERITIADRAIGQAEALAARLRHSSADVQARAVDANDHRGLVAAISGHDVAASALGPFFHFEAKLARAAIEADADYVSICDEWEAVEQVMEGSHEAAVAAGRTVITGMGASPGLTNVGIGYMSSLVDSLRRVHISCYQPLDAGGGEAVFKHMLYIMSGDVAMWRNGRRAMVPACSETRTVAFPHFGPIQLWNMGHSEPFTIPEHLPEIEEVSFFMGYGQGAQFFVKPAQWGWFNKPRWLERAARAMASIDSWLPDKAPGLGALRIDAWGLHEGKQTHQMICGTGEMREVTGLALSVGTLMIGRGELLTSSGGVFAPEACIAPEPFIRTMADKGVCCYSDLEMRKPLRV